MYAIIRTGGKQYKVQAGDLLKVEKLNKEAGDEFDMEEVLLVSGKSAHMGSPLVDKAKVSVVVNGNGRGEKILVFKKKRRKGYRKTQGHRQDYTEIFVKSITAPDGESVSAELKKAAKTEKAEKTTKQAGTKKKTAKKKTSTKKKTTKKKTTKKATKKKTTKKKA